MIRVGLQTISWGPKIEDMNALVSCARTLGFQGLEFAQRTDSLGDATSLRQLLHDNHLRAIGLAGGSLYDRIVYATELGPDYLYVDEWDEQAISMALAKGIKVGLHPHMYKDIQTVRDASVYLEQVADLGLILDTAHLFLAGDDVVEVLHTYFHRLVAVHMKDWTSRFGMSPHRFARGFTALGKGELAQQLANTLDYLIRNSYDGWIVVEQDSPNGDPVDSARVSRSWLRDHGVQ